MKDEMAFAVVFVCDPRETKDKQGEHRRENGVNRRLIDGSITGCGKCVGYCSFHEHPGYLTKELRKQHDCIKKGCYYYTPKKKEKAMIVSNPFAALLVAMSA